MSLTDEVKAQAKPVAGRCVVCALPERAEVDEALRVGKSTGAWGVVAITKALRARGRIVSESSLARHARNHVETR